ncbi:hypothetical protein [Streptomyces sp. NPDC056817]|uniref:hypothetical protein n=1 Tax=Streptomyces sp. NPDC056817 TaxID=3345950 RepID=UPI0036935BC0
MVTDGFTGRRPVRASVFQLLELPLAEVISHAVWLYFRFPLSYWEVEELMLQRGVVVSYILVQGVVR